MHLGLTISQIVEVVEGQTSLDPSFFIEKVSSLSSATPYDLAIIMGRGDASVFGSIALEEISNSKAGAILSAQEIVSDKPYILVKDPLRAYQKLIAYLERKKQVDAKSALHPSAIIAEKTQIGSEAFVGPYAIISEGATIGDATSIGAQVFIGKDCSIGSQVIIYPGARILDRCIIGDNTIIHANTVVGSDGFGYQVNARGMEKIPHIGRVRIGKFVEIGANCSIDRAVFEETVIGNGVKIDNNVHIAHGVHIGDHTAILALTGIAGSAQIGQGCQIGGQVGIKDHVKVGNGAKIVSQSAVLKDLPDGAVVAGTPAIPFGQWKRISVAITHLPELMKKASSFEQSFTLKQNKSVWWVKKLFNR